MIQPINTHILIEPEKHESFISSQKDTYEEIGVVIDIDPTLSTIIQKGTRVYFDSWLAAKYPKKDSDEFYWLVKHEDIRAIENVE